MNDKSPEEQFESEKRINIEAMGSNSELHGLSLDWNIKTSAFKYTYNFSSLGRPIIQFPQDMVALHEIIWDVRPDLIVECGIAHGGSLIHNASMLAMLDYCDAVEIGEMLDPMSSKRKVLGIDIDIREHNRTAIEAHPLSLKIDMIQGSSISPDVIQQVWNYAKDFARILVILDSNHTHDHVLAELKAYAPLTSKGSYCIVFDTIVEDLPDDMYPDRPWGKGNNPKTAVWEYLDQLKVDNRMGSDNQPLNFEIDKNIENKLLITVAPDGFLLRA
jgi:cephalosporin hydroxylase